MYRLWNYLFGWDYIVWTNPLDSGIARVHLEEDGRVWYWVYKSMYIWNEIKEPNKVLWLTCKSSKYSKGDKDDTTRD